MQVLGERVCSTRRVVSLVLGEGCAVSRVSAQYQKGYISSRKTECVV